MSDGHVGGAKFNVTIQIRTQFCPGEHPDPNNVGDHTTSEMIGVFRITPPQDDVPDWPPTTQADISDSVVAMLKMLGEFTAAGYATIQGCTFVGWAIQDD